MRLSVASSALAAAFVLTPAAAGYAPALCQDFSITNQVEPANAAHRDLMRQLQAWWDAHAHYPRHASNSDEGGTVKVHLVILPDGRIWTVDVVASSGSPSLDTAGSSVFREGFVRPFPEGEPKADIDLSLHYVLAHRHDQPVAAGYTQVLSEGTLKGLAAQVQTALKSGDLATAARLSDQLSAGLAGTPAAQPVAPAPPGAAAETAGAHAISAKARLPFTIMNDPVKSPILETMLQRTCTGTVMKGGITNHPWYGMRIWAQAIFFRKPDGTPWVKFYEGGYPSLSPVTEVGKMVEWTGRQQHLAGDQRGDSTWIQYTVWPDGDNHLSGATGSRMVNNLGIAYNNKVGGPVDLTCATEVLPAIAWNDLFAQKPGTSPFDLAASDPP
jgi:TonB family protein